MLTASVAPGRRCVAGGWKTVGGVRRRRVEGELKEGGENMVMHVYIRRGQQSFHLENGINGAHHIISAPQLLDKIETDKNMATTQVSQHYRYMHKYSIMWLWFI